MARITVEDCLEKVDNRFKLIHMAAKRVRQLRKGAEPLVTSKNTDTVVSLREIAAGAVYEGDYTEPTFLLDPVSEDSQGEDAPIEAASDAPVEKIEDLAEKPEE